MYKVDVYFDYRTGIYFHYLLKRKWCFFWQTIAKGTDVWTAHPDFLLKWAEDYSIPESRINLFL